MYALGYTRAELARHYIAYPLLIIPLDAIVISPALIAASLLLPPSFLGLNAAVIIQRELRYTPVALMGGGRDAAKVGWLEQRPSLDALGFKRKCALVSSSLTGTYTFVYEYKFDRLRDAPLPPGAEPFSAAFFIPERGGARLLRDGRACGHHDGDAGRRSRRAAADGSGEPLISIRSDRIQPGLRSDPAGALWL